MLHKVCTLADGKLKDEGSGGFSGYGSVFAVRDHAGEIVVKGAFQRSLDRFKTEGFIALQHEYSHLPVATVKDAYEDQRGLFIDCDFHSTEEAQKARTYVRERLERGKSVGLSIGYQIKAADMERTKDGVLLKEIDLWEVSIVTKPCNPEAMATAVKASSERVTRSSEQKGDYLGPYVEAEMTLAALYDLADTLRWRCFWNYLFDDEMSPSDREAAFDGALREFHELAMRCVRTYNAAPAEEQASLAEDYKRLIPEESFRALPPAGRVFAKQLELMRELGSDCTKRFECLVTERAKEGRFPLARLADMKALHEEIGRLLALAPEEEKSPDLDILRVKARAWRNWIAVAQGECEYEPAQ